ncbi:MAG: DUF4954 family protein, partial [Calditrichaeota bacterium]
MTFRRLTEAEKSQLVRQGCRVEDWEALNVGENFTPDHIHNSWFSGENYIGRLDGAPLGDGEITGTAGIYSSRLHGCRIDDEVRICNVGQLANMDIESGSMIENVHSLTVASETTFGNGISVDVLNEAGGRSIRIFDRLSAQLAYIMIFYRHRPELIRRLESLIDQYVQTKRS